MLQKKTYFFLLLFFATILLKAQTHKISIIEENNKRIETILLQNKNFGGDILFFKKSLEPLSKSIPLRPVYHALLANFYSQTLDKINSKSDFHYSESILLAKKEKNSALVIWTQLNYISYLYNYRLYAILTPILLEVMNKLPAMNTNEIIIAGESFKKIGWILQSLQDYEDSQYYLKLALKHTPKNTSEYATILYAIGVNFFNKNNLPKAKQYFKETAQVSKQINDTLRYAKTLGSLAQIHQKNGNIDKAILLLKEDIFLSEKCKDDKNKMYAMILLSQFCLDSNRLDCAEKMLNSATLIAHSKSYYNISELKIVQLKLAILQKQNKTNDELKLRRRLAVLENSLKNRDGDLAIRNASWMVSKTKLQQKINQSKLQLQRESFWKKGYAFVSIIVALLALFIYSSFRKRLKNKNLEYNHKVVSLQMDKIIMEKKIYEAHEDLNSQVDYLKNKNIQIKKLKGEIDTIKQSSSHYLETKNGKLTALLKSHLMTENNWRIFKREFENEHPHFYKMLITEFKEITDSNLRILLLQKLDFSNNEIAELLGVTPEAIKKSKQRLKKKLGVKYDKLHNSMVIDIED